MTQESGISDKRYAQIVAELKTIKNINKSRLQWQFWLSSHDASDVLKRLQADKVIGPPHVDADLNLTFHDVIGNNEYVQASSKTRLWLYQLQTAYDFSRFLWLMLKNKLLGRKHLLDIVPDAFTSEAAKWGIEYRISENRSLADGTRCISAELKQPVESSVVAGFSQGVETHLKKISSNFKVRHTTDRVEVSYLDPSKKGQPTVWVSR